MAKKKSRFAGQVAGNAREEKARGSQYGYLKLPKGVQMYKEDDVLCSVDIMPYVVTSKRHPDRNDEAERAIPGAWWYKLPFKTHRDVGPNNDTVVCPTTFNMPCPVCENRVLLAKNPDTSKDEIKELYPKQRTLYTVIPIGHKKYEEVPHVWDISYHLFQNTLNDELEVDEQNEVFPDLEEGLTLSIRFKERKFEKNTFYEARSIKFVERDEAYDEDIMKDIPALDELLTVLSYKQLEALYYGMESELDDGTGETEPEPEPEEDSVSKPKRKPKKAAPEPAPAPEPEPEEEPTQAPRPQRKAKSEKVDSRQAKRDAAKAKAAKADDGQACPEGFDYPMDCDQHDECEKCDGWEDCFDAKEAAKAKK